MPRITYQTTMPIDSIHKPKAEEAIATIDSLQHRPTFTTWHLSTDAGDQIV